MQPSHSFPYHFVIVWQFDQSYLSPNCTRVTYQWETVSTRFQTVFDLSRQECRKIVFTTYFKELVDHSNDIPLPPSYQRGLLVCINFPTPGDFSFILASIFFTNDGSWLQTLYLSLQIPTAFLEPGLVWTLSSTTFLLKIT